MAAFELRVQTPRALHTIGFPPGRSQVGTGPSDDLAIVDLVRIEQQSDAVYAVWSAHVIRPCGCREVRQSFRHA